MKVGTDGTLLGAWADGGKRILDIGTGSGLIALMMAQRFPESHIVALDIDEASCRQAAFNVGKSPFSNQIEIKHYPVQNFVSDEKFDSIVCNPPFFVGSLGCPDEKRNIARHASSLTFRDLLVAVSKLLDYSGCFSAIIPAESYRFFDGVAIENGFRCVKCVGVRTVPHKPIRRYLVSYSKDFSLDFQSSEQCIEDGSHNRSSWYSELTKDFYL